MAVRKGLGRGLDVMIPNKIAAPLSEKEAEKEQNTEQKKPAENAVAAALKVEPAADGTLMSVDILKVDRNKQQPRKKFDENGLEELADSLRQVGVLQPLLVVKKGEYYEIVAGERRWRAAQLAGL